MNKKAAILIAMLMLSAVFASIVSAKEQTEEQIKQAIIEALKEAPNNAETRTSQNLQHNAGNLIPSAAILLEEPITINIDGVEYKKESYEMKVGSGDYDKTSYIIFTRSDRKPVINAVLVPGDNMLGEYAFAYPFSDSLAKEIIDGTVKNKKFKFVNLLSKLTDGRVAVVVVDKVRAAYVPSGLSDYSFTKSWTLETYENDLEKIIADANARTGVRTYLTAGHSRGGETIQLFGKNPSGLLLATIPLDIVGEYAPGSEGYQNSISTLKALNDYTAEGNDAADISGLFSVLDLAQYYPNDPTPIPEFAGLTNMQVAWYMLENTGALPGPLTSVTGLSDSWYLKKYCAGDLANGLYYTDINKLFRIRDAGGLYPITPLALEKQSLEKRTHGGIDGTGLKIDFGHWRNGIYDSINAQDGFRLDGYTKTLMRNGVFEEIPGGHLDLLELIK